MIAWSLEIAWSLSIYYWFANNPQITLAIQLPLDSFERLGPLGSLTPSFRDILPDEALSVSHTGVSPNSPALVPHFPPGPLRCI